MRLGYDLALSERLKEFLDEGTLNRIMDQVMEDMKGELIATHPSDSATREILYHEIHALGRVRLRLSTIVSDLLMAERRD